MSSKGGDPISNTINAIANPVMDGLKIVTDGVGNVIDETDKGIALIDGRAQRAAETEAKQIEKKEEAKRAKIKKDNETRKRNAQAIEDASGERSRRVSKQKKARSNQIISDNLGVSGGEGSGTKNLLGL